MRLFGGVEPSNVSRQGASSPLLTGGNEGPERRQERKNVLSVGSYRFQEAFLIDTPISQYSTTF